MLKNSITLASWYGIGNREVELCTIPSRSGVKVQAYLPGSELMELGEVAEKVVSWDEIERSESIIKQVATELAREVVQKSMPTKVDGEVYSDGSN